MQEDGPRTMKEEEEREDIGGKQPGWKEDQKGEMETVRSSEEERSRGPQGGNLLLGGGVNGGPARKEDIAKEPRHVPGGVWLDKVCDALSTTPERRERHAHVVDIPDVLVFEEALSVLAAFFQQRQYAVLKRWQCCQSFGKFFPTASVRGVEL
ncbi:hypothetical protein NDU88_003883 [Pleurodeles waltl]|uniref:Uncharacterized protein n=1 Tax=Pleurodeles waltl TaxID=8319 RepID=A0AAV7PAU8_PLEWA|nr:hypothetical protein NDU88_003883 [Pleurodeles waltl]